MGSISRQYMSFSTMDGFLQPVIATDNIIAIRSLSCTFLPFIFFLSIYTHLHWNHIDKSYYKYCLATFIYLLFDIFLIFL